MRCSHCTALAVALTFTYMSRTHLFFSTLQSVVSVLCHTLSRPAWQAFFGRIPLQCWASE
jgi:hypothetical protein